MGIEVIGDGHIDGLFPFCHKWCRDFGNGICSDASLENRADESHYDIPDARLVVDDLIIDELFVPITLL